MSDTPTPARRPVLRRRLVTTAATLILGSALFVTGALVLPANGPSEAKPPAPEGEPGVGGPGQADPARTRIRGLQERLRRLPEDHDGWARLGIAYVEQAQRAADPGYYPKAERALRRSMKIHPDGNQLAQLGMGALAAGRHQFGEALDHALRAVRLNPHHAASYGVLADAYVQLGRYEESFEATQEMVDLLPATPSLARASYAWELRGDVDRAADLMQRSLDAAAGPGDAAFARYHLALLTLHDDPEKALQIARTGLRAQPDDAGLLEARAKAHLALGHTDRAVGDLTAAAAAVPRPGYVLALGELHESLGHTERAERQYDLYRDQMRLLDAAGVTADAETVLFEADHGDARRAVRLGREAVRRQPFLAVQDAYAWALHSAGRDREALVWADRALQLGTRSALYRYHRGMIHASLGNDAAARSDLRAALDIEPRFHPLHTATARAALERIGPAS